jgi:GNAT superfamily N-acetyltransferase
MAQVDVREIGADGWRSVRDVRLAALQEAPEAFASSYERESAFSEEDWLRRFAMGGGNFLAYIPELGPAPAGIVGCFESAPGTTELVSMWVRPGARGYRIGDALVGAVVQWARQRGHDQVHLWVTDVNDAASRLYKRCGFTPTGEQQAMPSDPQVAEIAMARPAQPQP